MYITYRIQSIDEDGAQVLSTEYKERKTGKAYY